MKDPDGMERMRRRVLREWGRPDEPLDLNSRVNLAGKFVARILREAGAADGIEEERVKAVWRQLAGDFVANHCEPVSLRNGELSLRVVQPAMRFHLEQMRPVLLKRLREEFGDKLRSVRFVHG